jgi:hypothetical protein
MDMSLPLSGSAQTEQRQDEQDNDHEADEIDDAVHI